MAGEIVTDQERAKRIWDICQCCALAVYGDTGPSTRYAMGVARLLFGTAAQESGLVWERQRTPRWDGEVGGFSKWQLEPDSVRAGLRMLETRPALCRRAGMYVFADENAPDDALLKMPIVAHLWALRMDDADKLGCLFARLHYFRVAEPVPEGLWAQAEYWKKYYNTSAGKGTPGQYVQSWERLCRGIAA